MAIGNRTLGIIVGSAVVVLAAAGFYAWREGLFGGAPSAPPVVAAPSPPPPQAPAPEHHPVPEADNAAKPLPLPPLAESDAVVRQALAELLGQEVAERSFVHQNLVRRIVATVDNLPREKLANEMRPVPGVGGKFLVSGTEDAPVLDPRNFDRYHAAVAVVGGLDARKLAAVYFRLYPLFQSAYEALGYPSAYFNDRLIAVIDHLLETPEVKGPIELVQPRVAYEFADPDLESRSAGQKLLIRMGPANAAIVEGKLRELRSALTAAR
jgi:hypothetical protein